MQTIDAELEMLSKKLPAGVVGSTIMSMISSREAKRARLATSLTATTSSMKADILPEPVLLRRFEKTAGLRETLNDTAVRAEAAATITSLVEGVTVHPALPDDPVGAEVKASAVTLLRYE